MTWIVVRVVLDGFLALFVALWIIFPAYLANAVAVPLASSRRERRSFHPIDGGRYLGKHRLLGDGKTIEGFAFATIIGMAGGIVQWVVSPLFLHVSLAWHDVYRGLLVPKGDLLFHVGPTFAALARALLLPVGSTCGDVIGSFVKRRLGKARGERVPLLDQLDFLGGAFMTSLFATSLGGSLFQVPLGYIVIIVVLTAPIHLAANKLAFRWKMKDVAH